MEKRRRALGMKRAFLDSSVLFTAVNSPSGGSAKLFTLDKIKLVTSKVVLAETERNVRKKLRSYHLKRFFLLVGQLEILDQKPNSKLIEKARGVIVKKDAVILAEAKKAQSDFLITLDRKHFFTPSVAKFIKPQQVLTPKMLLSGEA
ncbi:type II toxin-antitoxin system VapC family toxin [Candidatus Parcubacteria bacterium]|nr:type II toxin-antitoxin system VapC family toxin [Candidatus Parcubacteria bacterium]